MIAVRQLTHSQTRRSSLTHVESTRTDTLLQKTSTGLGALGEGLLDEVHDCVLSVLILKSGLGA